MWKTRLPAAIPTCYNEGVAHFTNRSTVQKVGNSLTVLIPAELARAVSLSRGDQVMLNVMSDDSIVVTRVPFKYRETILRG